MTVHIIGGGTLSFVRNHLALAAPAFGNTARFIHSLYMGTRTSEDCGEKMFALTNTSRLHLTKMADSSSDIVTNADVAALLDCLIADPTTRVIYLNAALCDFDGAIMEEGFPGEIADFSQSGKYGSRLKSRDGMQTMLLAPADKLLGRIRKERKDIFLVAFKTTTGATSDEQYRIALDMLKANSCNLVLANDTVTRNNMVVAPEETRYHETTDRGLAIRGLVEMVKSRSTNTFTRSEVVPGSLYRFETDHHIPDNLRQVVKHLVARGAYKPFRGATAGHFAVRLDDHSCLTSRRKTDYTQPGGLDLVEVEYDGFDKVKAYGAKPSVGGQSQRIVFAEHDGFDCIVHAHIALKEHPRDLIPVAEQWPNECGSHQCGAATSRHLQSFNHIKAVMLSHHGPNIVFGRNTPSEDVIDFIEANFDIGTKTGGSVTSIEMEIA